MMKHIAFALALFSAGMPVAQAQAATKQPRHLILDVTCGGYEFWYQDNSVWGAHGACGMPNVTEGGLIAKMGGQKYIIATATYESGIVVTTRFTMPVDGHGTWDSYATDGTSPPAHDSGTYTTE